MQFKWEENKEVLENQTRVYRTWQETQIYSVFNHSSSRIKIVPKDSKFRNRMPDEWER